MIEQRTIDNALVDGVIRKTDLRHQAVEQARIILGHHVLLNRAARAARADGVDRHAELLDEVLLHHHHGLRRDHVVAIVAEHIQG